MFLKRLRKACFILKQELLTMQVQKYGKTCRMIIKVIYGV